MLQPGATPPSDPDSLLPWTAVALASADAFTLDAWLCATVRTMRTVEPRLGRLLRLLVDHRLYREIGHPALEHYLRNRLGLSLRKTWALVRVERNACRAPAFADAYQSGRLSWVQALTLLPVLDRDTAAEWVARAESVTVRRLVDEVTWALDARDAGVAHEPVVPPPLGSVLVSPRGAVAGDISRGGGDGRETSLTESASEAGNVQVGAPRNVGGTLPQSGTMPAPVEVAGAEVSVTAPVSVVLLLRDALEAFASAGEPRWRALERLLVRVIRDWESAPRHPDPVFARDGWRCTVPGCSTRRTLHDHHIRSRSRRGDDRRSNRTTVCAAHHLHGIHAGVVRAWGEAPANVHWQLGVRADGPPLLAYLGDVLEASAGGSP